MSIGESIQVIYPFKPKRGDCTGRRESGPLKWKWPSQRCLWRGFPRHRTSHTDSFLESQSLTLMVQGQKHSQGKDWWRELYGLLDNGVQINTVTVENSCTAPGTLGSYQTLDWARLAGQHAGVIMTERNHIYHLMHNIYWDITSSQHIVHGMVMAHEISSAVHQVGHLMTPQNRITCQLHLWA